MVKTQGSEDECPAGALVSKDGEKFIMEAERRHPNFYDRSVNYSKKIESMLK